VSVVNESWQWLMDFVGVNNGENAFATHMYNFWSGFGGNVSVLAVLGAGLGAYRHHVRQVAALNPLHHRHRTGGEHQDGQQKDGEQQEGEQQED
jgi:hypothetical protein